MSRSLTIVLNELKVTRTFIRVQGWDILPTWLEFTTNPPRRACHVLIRAKSRLRRPRLRPTEGLSQNDIKVRATFILPHAVSLSSRAIKIFRTRSMSRFITSSHCAARNGKGG
jgi:hypothetical protein